MSIEVVAAWTVAAWINGFFTLFCSFVIFSYVWRKTVTRCAFYYSWALGFFVYGFAKLLYTYHFPGMPLQLQVLGATLEGRVVSVLFVVAFFFFIFGIWSLTKSRRLLFLILSFSAVAVMCLWWLFSGTVNGDLLELALVLVYSCAFLLVGATILWHRMKFGGSADKLGIGWFLLFVTNLFLPAALGDGSLALALLVGESLAILSKVIILLGLLDYDFILVAEKTRRELEKSHLPPKTVVAVEGGLKLVIPTQKSKVQITQWLKRTVSRNVDKEVDTLLFVFQDTVPYKQLRELRNVNPEKVKVFLFSSSAKKSSEDFLVFPMGLTQVGATLSQIARKCQESKKGCVVVLLNLSILIHLFGAKQVYNTLLNKMGIIRQTGISLVAVFHPDTHSDQSIGFLFKKTADEVMEL
ncbi:hypothetical protein KAI12_03780 [Candidatus Bathyarchaeota archaeon]|nr:hypothetical protein [Candidatus Bathyarchaeota archaeon]